MSDWRPSNQLTVKISLFLYLTLISFIPSVFRPDAATTHRLLGSK